jgi:hypothetical protein
MAGFHMRIGYSVAGTGCTVGGHAVWTDAGEKASLTTSLDDALALLRLDPTLQLAQAE